MSAASKEYLDGYKGCMEDLKMLFDKPGVFGSQAFFPKAKKVVVNEIEFEEFFDLLKHNPDIAKMIKDEIMGYLEAMRLDAATFDPEEHEHID